MKKMANASAPTPMARTAPCLMIVATKGSTAHIPGSPGLPGMRGRGVYNPDSALFVIGQVPNPPAAADLDLPLLQGPAMEVARREASAELVVRVVLRWPRVHPHQLIGIAGLLRGMGAQATPAPGCLIGAEPDVPLTR